MAPPTDTAVRLGLVGTGADLVKAIEALKGLAAVEIAIVADASDRSEGAKLAHSLKLPVVKNAMEVFRSKANIVLEVNGDDRQYERLLSIKPPGTEVMSVRGARLLITLLKQAGGNATAGVAPPKEVIKEVPVEVVREVEVVKEVVKEVPVEVVKEVVREVPVEVVREVEVVKEVPVEVVKEVVKEVPVEVVKEVLREVPNEVVKEVVKEVEVVKEIVTEVPVEVVREVVKEVPVEVVREIVKEVPVEIIREVEVVREVPVEVPVEVIRQMDTVKVEKVEVPVEVVKEVEVVREVVKEVPVEIIKEVVKEVPVEVVKEVVKEVPVEVVREVVKEVPVEVVREMTRVDEQEMQRLRRRLEELQTQYDQLVTVSGRVPVDEKMQALLTMASGVGHIFNNVLAGILGRTQLLLKKAERDKAKELISGLSEIEAATRTGIDALTRIQEFSRARPSEALARVDLNDVVQRAIEQTRPKWRDEPAGKGVRIELITHFGAHAPVLGVETELLEALSQLIVNAVDAMPRGGTITVRTGNETGRGFMAVSDTGTGMAENVRRRAFEPFFSTRGETGLGLGLSVVYGIMVRHGGDAQIESESGKGTTITLHVPTAPEGPAAPAAAAESDQAQVLVVDDDETVRTALGDMLRGAGYGVTLAASGLEGIAKVREREGPFHLVVTDLGMPDVPGWEVVEAVKQVETATPVVIMSGFDRARATRRAKELGVDLVISKPFDLQDFLNAVRGLLLGRKRG